MYGDLPLIDSDSTDGSTQTQTQTQTPGFPVLIQNSPTGPKTCVLRLPETAEMLTYMGALKSRVRLLGNRKSKGDDIPNPSAVLKLFKAIRIDRVTDQNDFDADEAQYAIDLLTTHKIKGTPERSGQSYTVVIATLFGDCTHVVRMPYQKERAEYERLCCDPTILPHGVQELRYPPEVACKLYDAIVTSSAGYNPGVDVPPIHKRTVVIEVVNQLSALDPALDPLA